MSEKAIRDIGSDQVPYFRTPEFSQVLLENEKLICRFFHATEKSRVIFVTGSGTAAMDASISNCLNENDNVLVINGGSFGHRLCEICDVYELKYTEIKCELGKTLTKEQLYQYNEKNYTALLVNLDETSTGVLYDIEMISEFCKKNNIFLLVDSISSFLCDPFDMEKLGVNLVLTGSQKALALQPGISLICVDEVAQQRILNNKPKTYYFNLKRYLSDGERGQTPFTPAVGILNQLNKRLRMIEENGGVDSEINRTIAKAEYFRSRITSLPFELFADKMSNAVTSIVLKDKKKSAYTVFEYLKNEYGIWICPNGGDLKDLIFRVGHIGDLSFEDYDKLIEAFKDLVNRKII